MRVGIAYYESKKTNFNDISKRFEKVLIDLGHQVEIVDLVKTNDTLTKFNFIIFGIDTTSMFGGKIPVGFFNRLRSAGTITGKHVACFVDKKIGSFKTLQNLMKFLEKEGCLICSSEIIASLDHATYYASKMSIY